MKFSFFNETSGQKLGVTSVTRGLTSVLSKLAPRLSASVGNRILLQPRGKREYDFKDFPSHREMNIMTSIGVAHVNLFGSGDKLVVISHGWADNSYSFQRMIRSLIEQGYLVAALDHIGHGKSSGNKSHLLSFIETMELLLGKFAQERLHVEAIIGHSMGAYATLNLPHQLLEDKKIILISSPVQFFQSMFNKIEQFGISRNLTKSVLDSVARQYGKDWQQLGLENSTDKLTLDITFIHDKNDRHAPFADIEQYLKHANTPLIETEGLGHSRILGDTNVIRNIAQVLST